MRPFPLLLAAIAFGCPGIDAAAQFPAGMPSMTAAEKADANAACESLAALPNPPMSVQACKSLLGMAGTAERMRSTAADPSARRPGDERMSCDAIFAEMTTMGSAFLAESGPAKVEATVAEGLALQQRQSVEGTAFIAGTFALGAAMGLASPVMPNFVAAAIAVAWQASALSLGKKLGAEQAALRPRRDDAIVTTADEFEDAMTGNPRFARLTDLALDKGCEPPAGAGPR